MRKYIERRYGPRAASLFDYSVIAIAVGCLCVAGWAVWSAVSQNQADVEESQQQIAAQEAATREIEASRQERAQIRRDIDQRVCDGINDALESNARANTRGWQVVEAFIFNAEPDPDEPPPTQEEIAQTRALFDAIYAELEPELLDCEALQQPTGTDG